MCSDGWTEQRNGRISLVIIACVTPSSCDADSTVYAVPKHNFRIHFLQRAVVYAVSVHIMYMTRISSSRVDDILAIYYQQHLVKTAKFTVKFKSKLNKLTLISVHPHFLRVQI